MSLELLGAIAIVSLTGVYYIWRYSEKMPRYSWLIVTLSFVSWVWLLAAILTPPKVAKTSYHVVVPRMQSDGSVVDTIMVDGKPVNVNIVLGRHLPFGYQIKRIEYKDSILGLKFHRSPSYEY